MKCVRCGSAVNQIAKYCGLCRRPLDAPPGWELPEHDDPTFKLAVPGIWRP